MKAIVIEGINQPLVVKEVSLPVLEPGEALVRVHAASFNRRDWWIQQGKYAGLKYPITPGSDGAGTVEDIRGTDSERDTWLHKRVIINPSLHWTADSSFQPAEFKILGLPDDGTFAEYIKVPIPNLFAHPEHLNTHEAAAIPLAGLTAFRAVFKKGNLKKDEQVLITGIGGGVATFALQWAVNAGATVYVTSGQDSKIGAAIQLGAVGGTNYRSDDWHERLKAESDGFDLIIDSALGKQFAHFPDLSKPGGRIVFFGGTAGNIPPLDGRKIFWKQLTIAGTTMGSAHDFAQMLDFVNRHQIRPVIDSVHPLENADTAIRKMGDSSQFGKIVLEIP